MAVPKRKTSKARRDQRSSSWGINVPAFGTCGNEACGEPKLPHVVCEACGFYRGKKVIRTQHDRAMSREERQEVSSDQADTEGAESQADEGSRDDS